MTRAMRANENAADGADEFPFLLPLLAYLVCLTVVQLAVLGLSLASLRLTRPGAMGIFGVSLLAVWLFGHRLKASLRNGRPLSMFSNDRWGWTIAGTSLALYLFLLGCAAIGADHSWDGNSYHLPVIQEWFQQGRITWLEGPAQSSLPFINGYPKAAEASALFLCVLVHPALSNALNLVYLPLGILGIASIAHALGAGRRGALAAGAALLLVPVNLGQSMTTYVDSAFSSAVIAWLAVMVWLRRQDLQLSTVQALALGCALGQVMGIKGTGLLLAAVGSLILCGLQLSARPAARPTLAGWWLGVATCALAVAGFWYARNLAHGLSPLYPVGVSVAGRTLFPGLEAYAMPGAFAVDNLIESWPVPAQVAFTWLQGLWRWPDSIVGFDMRLGGIGFLWVLGCLPAVIALVRARMRTWTSWREELVREPLWLLLAVVSTSFVLVPQPWWSRYTVWLYGLGLPCLAVVGGWPMHRRGRAWLAACVAVAVIEAGIVLARWQLPIVGIAIRDEHGGPPRPGPAVPIPTHFYPPWVLRGTVIERLARANDTVGIGPLQWYQEVIFGVVSEPVGARQVHFVPADLEADFAAWYERVRPRYVIMDESIAIPASMRRLQSEVHHVRSLIVVQFW